MPVDPVTLVLFWCQKGLTKDRKKVSNGNMHEGHKPMMGPTRVIIINPIGG